MITVNSEYYSDLCYIIQVIEWLFR